MKQAKPLIIISILLFIVSITIAECSVGLNNNNTLEKFMSAKNAKKQSGKDILFSLQNKYRAMKAIKLSVVSMDSVKHNGKPIKQNKPEKKVFIFKRPYNYSISSSDSQVIMNGKQIYTYFNKPNRYVKQKFDKRIIGGLITSRPGVGVIGLLNGVDYTKIFSKIDVLPDKSIKGQAAFGLSMVMKSDRKANKATQTLWIRKKDYAILFNEVKLHIEQTPNAKSKTKGRQKLDSTMTSNTISFIINPKISASSFNFSPPKGAKPFEEPKLPKLLNKKAPDFSFKLSDGNEKKLSDYRPKPVLLYFWALPMAEKNLPVIQAVFNEKGAKINVLGINFNTSPAEVEKYRASNKITFPSVAFDKKIALIAQNQYGIQALPTLVLIDSKGIVKEAWIGLPTKQAIYKKIKEFVMD